MRWGTRWYLLKGMLETVWVALAFLILCLLTPFVALSRLLVSDLYHRGYL